MAEKFKCDCGHTETETNIYEVISWDEKKVFSVCYKCWDNTPMNVNDNKFFFKNESHQNTIIK